MATRASVLALPPTYGVIADKQDAYVPGYKLRGLAKQTGRYWAFHSAPTTVALPGNRFVKSLSPFGAHDTEALFLELLREYAEAGTPRPSGYADVFHDKFFSPRVSWSVNAQLARVFAGGWQEAIQPGWHKGTYYKYDLRSAYLWAASLGLPDTRTYTRSLTPWRSKYDGLYRVRLLEPNPAAPFPYNRATEVIATNTEIDNYSLRVGEVLDGVTWRTLIDPRKIMDAIYAVSTWKLAARAFWGRWAQWADRVECVAQHGEKRWTLPNMALNIPWAHLIVGRVRQRLWECAKDALHVYVDSVITPHTLPIGCNIGDWKLEKTYSTGVVVIAPGRYGDSSAPQLERMAGMPLESAHRSMAII